MKVRTSSIDRRTSRIRDVFCEVVQVASFGKIVWLLLAADRADPTAILAYHAPHCALNAHGDDVKDATEVILVRELNWKKKCVGGTFRNGHVDALKFFRRDPIMWGRCRL